MYSGEHGIASADIETIEPHQSDIDGLCYVKVSCPGYPAVLITVGNATNLATHLRHAHVQDLADRFQEQADRPRICKAARQCRARPCGRPADHRERKTRRAANAKRNRSLTI
jgi:hypothetical protein